jgi:hypothetical protein
LFRHFLLQIGGANLGIRLLRRRSQRKDRLCSFLLSTAVRDFPTLAARTRMAGVSGRSPEIVQPRANLWMTFEGTCALWIDSSVQICHQV